MLIDTIQLKNNSPKVNIKVKKNILLKTYSYIGTFRLHMLHRRLGTTCFITHVSIEYSSSGRRWTCLSVDQVKALPSIVAFPVQRFLPGEQSNLLPRSCF